MGTAQPPVDQGPLSNLRLDSWKEIASYLKRDIRTVQLWEKHEGLPVHRHAHSTRASVYAYVAEIDAWQRKRQPQNEELTSLRQPSAQSLKVAAGALPFISRKATASIALGVVVLFAVGIAISKFRQVHRQRSIANQPGVLAVLPFEDLSAGPVESYLADGLTDDLITTLGRAGRLQVISRTSVMRFKGKHESLPQIAETLHANLILEGTIAYSGKRARVTAQLIDATTDRHLWANSYESPFDNILTMQDEIAEQVASSILQEVLGASASPIPIGRLTSPEVRQAYLKGRFLWNKRDEPGLKEANRYFDEAISKDPNYAPAYSGLADCYNLLSVWGSLSPRESFPKAKEAALKALQLDPNSSEAYTSLAFETYRFDWDFAAAERYFQKAIQLNANYATAHQWYGEFLSDMKRPDQGIAELTKAKQLDPLSPIVASDLSAAYSYAGRIPDAVHELEQILAIDPSFAVAHNYLASAYADAGQTAKAKQEEEIYSRITGIKDSEEMAPIKQALASGKKTEARQLLKSLASREKEGRFGYVQLAQMFVAADDKDEAFNCLEKAYQEHSWWLVTLLVDQNLAPLRNDPRFQDLRHRVGLPQH